MKIYTILGKEIRTLVDGERPAGEYRVIWDGRNDVGQGVESGVYFVRLQAGDPSTVSRQTFEQTRKVVLVR